jgi:hypothetical protein
VTDSKQCSTCREVKPIDQFPYDAGALDGHGHRCKPCHNRINREYRQTPKGKEARAQSMRRWREANKARNLAARNSTGPA